LIYVKEDYQVFMGSLTKNLDRMKGGGYLMPELVEHEITIRVAER
jgi:hypothetical protein